MWRKYCLLVLVGEQSHASLKRTRLLALTEWGNVSLWSIQSLAAGNISDRVGTDPGLRIGGHVCLMLLAATLPLGKAVPGRPGDFASTEAAKRSLHKQFQLHQRAAALSLPPGYPDQFLVGTDSGQVLRGSLYGEAPVPKVRP